MLQRLNCSGAEKKQALRKFLHSTSCGHSAKGCLLSSRCCSLPPPPRKTRLAVNHLILMVHIWEEIICTRHKLPDLSGEGWIPDCEFCSAILKQLRNSFFFYPGELQLSCWSQPDLHWLSHQILNDVQPDVRCFCGIISFFLFLTC